MKTTLIERERVSRWQALNPEKVRAYKNKYENENREEINRNRRRRRKAQKQPTPAELSQLLQYDKATGMFRWLNPKRQQTKGWHRGVRDPRNYYDLRIGYRSYRAHCVAWALMKGRWPDGFEIDHIDRNRSNNRWINLRKATRAQNAMNQSISKANKTGVRGVITSGDRFRAMIGVNRRIIYLGYFDTLSSAALARRQAELQYYGEFA